MLLRYMLISLPCTKLHTAMKLDKGVTPMVSYGRLEKDAIVGQSLELLPGIPTIGSRYVFAIGLRK